MKIRLYVVKWSVCAAVFGTAAAMIASSHAQAQTRQLTFGIIFTQSAENLQAGWQALLDHRQKSAGLTATVVIAPD